MATVKKPAGELRRGDVILAVNNDPRVPTMIVLRVRAGGVTLQIDAWNLTTWRAEAHTLPAGAECTVEAPDMPARPTMREVLELLGKLVVDDSGTRLRPDAAYDVLELLDRARRWGFL